MSTKAAAQLVLPVNEKRDHIKGPKHAPVTLVEYGDYECPFCGQAHFVLQELEGLAGDLMRFAFRNFPLTTMHPHAEHAAEAAEAAAAQGTFWEMHDALFGNQDALSDEDLVGCAAALGLDVHRFTRELAEGRYAPRVREDFISGVRSGVNGTPSFFINGLRYDGTPDLASLLAAIQEAAE
jgi:protein-disulfide isomerase